MKISGYFPADPVEFESIDPNTRRVEWLNQVGMFLMGVVLVTSILFPLHPILGDSMNPTYVNGQEAFCARVNFTPLSQGEVVIAYENSILLIKRVAACPGDTITITADGNVEVNGVPYQYGIGRADTTAFAGLTQNEDGSYSATMEDGQYYLLGDNRENSADSRYYGPFSRSAIMERVMFVL